MLLVSILQMCLSKLAGWDLHLKCIDTGFASVMRAFELSRKMMHREPQLGQQIKLYAPLL